MEIRNASVSDIPWLFEESERFASTYQASVNLAGNKEYALEFLGSVIKNHLVLIAEENGEPLGFIAGVITPHHFNPDIKQLSELLWWVREDKRSTGAGKILLDEFIKIGRETCDLITFTMEVNTPISDDVLTGRGFKLTEKAFVMECR